MEDPVNARRGVHARDGAGNGESLPEGFDDSRDVEAKFWDTTDVSELAEGELERVDVERAKRPRKTTFAIRLDQSAVELVRAIAELNGTRPTQLVRKWVMHRLELEQRSGVLADPVLDSSLGINETELRAETIATVMGMIPDVIERIMGEILMRADDEQRAIANGMDEKEAGDRDERLAAG